MLAMLLSVGVFARDDLILNVTLDYDQERDNYATQALFNDMARDLAKSIGVPVKLGSKGIEQIYEIKLNAEEKAKLAKSAGAVQELIDVLKTKM